MRQNAAIKVSAAVADNDRYNRAAEKNYEYRKEDKAQGRNRKPY